MLDSGDFCPVLAAVADAAAAAPAGPVLDAGAGTGHYLAAARSGREPAPAIGIDLSRFAARSVMRRRPPAAAVVADLWQPLPIADRAAAVILSVFAPRQAAEFARILIPGGHLIVVTPEPDHLVELREELGMLGVGGDKTERLAAEFADHFEVIGTVPVRTRFVADTERVTDLAAMGPTAFHRGADELAENARRLTAEGPIPVTLAVRLSVLRRR